MNIILCQLTESCWYTQEEILYTIRKRRQIWLSSCNNNNIQVWGDVADFD